MRIFWLIYVLLMSCKGISEHHHQAHTFDDADAWVSRFEDPERDTWQKPDEVIATLALAADVKVADIGSATGYFPVRFAKAFPQGRIYGVDIESSMVDYLNKRALNEQLPNLTSHLAEFADAKIPEPVDLVLMVNTYHHLSARPSYFKKLAASLNPGGRVAIIEFTKDSKMGPDDELKVSPEQVEAELKEAAYVLTQVPSFLPEQFFLIFRRAS